jgi:hypothetical protein
MTGKVDKYSRLRYWYFAVGVGSVRFVIRQRGANSISVGRTPHEMHDERSFTVPS